MKLHRRSLMMAAAATAGAPAIVRAQGDWPKGPIRIIVPFPPGGSTDPVARIIQANLVENNGWNVIVDNKPGGTGVVGAAIAAKAPPDGQTWLVVFDNHILNPAFAPNLPYKDSELDNVMLIGRTPQSIAAAPDRPYKTFAETVEDARKRPGKVSMGVLAASQALVLMTFLKRENGFDVNLIPYKGGGPLARDALAGVTDVSISSLASHSPHLRAGKLRPLAVTGEARTPALPGTPTLAEQGIKGYPSYSWWGLYAPAGTPRPIVDRMNTEVAKAVRSADVTRKFVDQFNMEILASSPEAFAQFHKVEQERWTRIIEEHGIRGD